MLGESRPVLGRAHFAGAFFYQNALHASASYAAAVAEAALLFPDIGAGEKPAPGDTICGGARRQVALGAGGKSLKEVVLVVLCEQVLEEEEHYNVVDSLMREDFRLVNLRQTWLSTKQATELAGALGHRYATPQTLHPLDLDGSLPSRPPSLPVPSATGTLLPCPCL